MRRVFVHGTFLALSLLAALPLLRVSHPPLQDLPQHLAAISVLKHYPDLGLGELFEIDLLRTQYLSYYGAAWLLSHLVGVTGANKLLLLASSIALPWSVAGLLDVLGRDRRAALFVFPLLYNAHLVLGFFNFIAALPCLFWGLSLAVKERQEPRRARAWGLAALMVLVFYTHVVPFALLVLGVGWVFWGAPLEFWKRRVFAFVPACSALVAWLLGAPAGRATLAAAGATAGDARAPTFTATAQAIRELPMWLTDVLVAEIDERLLVAWGVLFLLALALGTRVRGQPVEGEAATARLRDALAARLSLLSPLCLALYFVTPASYDWIWPISARFPLLALLFGVLLLPPLPELCATFLALGLSVHTAATFHFVDRAFQRFETEEVGEIEAALAAIPPAQHVLGLIFDRGSKVVKFSPFLHYAALYQAEKGGAVMFTFADFPQSPFHFKQTARPPRVPPRWEWQPERVRVDEELFYSYLLVRGGSRNVSLRTSKFEPVFRGPRWSVYRRASHM